VPLLSPSHLFVPPPWPLIVFELPPQGSTQATSPLTPYHIGLITGSPGTLICFGIRNKLALAGVLVGAACVHRHSTLILNSPPASLTERHIHIESTPASPWLLALGPSVSPAGRQSASTSSSLRISTNKAKRSEPMHCARRRRLHTQTHDARFASALHIRTCIRC
jgi:hypothetical protein